MQLEQKDLDAIATAVAAKITVPSAADIATAVVKALKVPTAADIAKAVWATAATSFVDASSHTALWYQQANDQNLHTIITNLSVDTGLESSKIQQIVQDGVTAALQGAGLIK